MSLYDFDMSPYESYISPGQKRGERCRDRISHTALQGYIATRGGAFRVVIYITGVREHGHETHRHVEEGGCSQFV